MGNENTARDEENAAGREASELSDALGAQVGLAAWDVDHGQPDMPDLFECREDYFHFPCGMCKYRVTKSELKCAGCRHYCP